jgi:hypothetical protein
MDSDTSTKRKRPQTTTKRKKSPLSQVLEKWINLIRQKDVNGFFCSPVDIKVVPDYKTIIKQPMDLGTMKQKVVSG